MHASVGTERQLVNFARSPLRAFGGLSVASDGNMPRVH